MSSSRAVGAEPSGASSCTAPTERPATLTGAQVTAGIDSDRRGQASSALLSEKVRGWPRAAAGHWSGLAGVHADAAVRCR